LKGIGFNGVPGTGAKSAETLLACLSAGKYGLSEDDCVIETKVIGGSEECKHVAKYFRCEMALELGLL